MTLCQGPKGCQVFFEHRLFILNSLQNKKKIKNILPVSQSCRIIIILIVSEPTRCLVSKVIFRSNIFSPKITKQGQIL